MLLQTVCSPVSAVIHYHPLSRSDVSRKRHFPNLAEVTRRFNDAPCGRTDKGDEACRLMKKSLTGDF